MTNPILACGVDRATLQDLAQEGLNALEVEPAALVEMIRQHPEAVLLTENPGELAEPVRVAAQAGYSLKVIQIVNSGARAPDFGDALKRHVFGLFRRPLDMESLAESVREAQEIQSWTDGIEVLSDRPNWLTLRVRSRRYTAERLVRFVRELLADLDSEERDRIGIAFRESLLNAMEHGAAFDESKHIYVSCLRTKAFLMYVIRDPGPGFSFDRLPHASISNPPGDPTQHMLHRAQQGIRPGGFGLMVAREMVDEMLHNETGNEVILIKYLPGSSEIPPPVAKGS